MVLPSSNHETAAACIFECALPDIDVSIIGGHHTYGSGAVLVAKL
jgi:hypothetical protein